MSESNVLNVTFILIAFCVFYFGSYFVVGPPCPKTGCSRRGRVLRRQVPIEIVVATIKHITVIIVIVGSWGCRRVVVFAIVRIPCKFRRLVFL